ncbi:MAG: response regulator, partial [Candidatus Hydrogenedentes bacterium]|nr:response regulator [Candidatus Hydrogenedentota bacterium]
MSPLQNLSPKATKLAGTILVVDDENGPRQALRLLLKEYVSIYTADNAQSAREFITHEGADVVVTDIRMPGESGIDLLQWIKDRQPATEVIILTGYGEVESAARAVELGAFAYLEKPFDNDQMVSYVRNALEKHNRELERRQLEKLALEANRFETVGRFISGMLHDLGTPLSVIATNIDLILLKPELPGKDKR